MTRMRRNNAERVSMFSKMMSFFLPTSTLLLAALGLSACSDSTNTKPAESTAVIPASFFLAERPDNVPMLREVKASTTVGDSVRFEARVGGRANPFVDGLAVFLSADPRLISCDQREGDGCPVPHDYCCEDAKRLQEGTATVQLVDSAGKLFAINAQGQGGIEPLKTIVVEGIVSEKADDGVFVVNATHIWVGSIPAAPPSEG